jgi:hypothetical protein
MLTHPDASRRILMRMSTKSELVDLGGEGEGVAIGAAAAAAPSAVATAKASGGEADGKGGGGGHALVGGLMEMLAKLDLADK